MTQQELESLSNAEIKQLWERTQNELRKQLGFREAQVRANADLGVSDDHYIDDFGNAIEGRRPAPKSTNHYIDPNGYVVDLKSGEKAPEASGNGLADWLKNQDVASDPELRAALGEDNLFFEERITIGEADVLLTGQLESKGWLVTSSAEGREFKFRLDRKLTRNEAIAAAVGYVRVKSGPQFKQLSEAELRMCERMSVANRLDAFVFYLQARLPDHLADRFLELGASGNELAIQKFAADEQISKIAEEAVAQTFYWSNPRASENFFEWVRANDGERMWTFALLDSLWNQYQTRFAIDCLDPKEPTTEEVVAAAEKMTDDELAAALAEARKLRSRSR